MSVQDGDVTQTSRSRLLSAGRTLFARRGYEQTSTAAIARDAGSSESQLIRYFGGKAGLLEAVFNEAWTSLNEEVGREVERTAHGREGVIRIVALLIEALSRDPETAFLFLFEGRRLRGGSEAVALSKGYLAFLATVSVQIARGQKDGSLRPDLPARILSSAVIGCAESMVRDRIMAERNREPDPFTTEEIITAFSAMVEGLG